MKLRAVYLLASMFLTVMLMVAAMVAMKLFAEPYFAERWATDICVAGSVKQVFIPSKSYRGGRVLKCTSKETGQEIFVPENKQLGFLPELLIFILIPILIAPLIVLGERLFFNLKVPPQAGR